jgi:hypothetical protein
VIILKDLFFSFSSFCTCDRDHGGFDCSDELVSPNGKSHINR